MQKTNMDVRVKLTTFWSEFFQDTQSFNGTLVSARCFLNHINNGEPTHTIASECDMCHTYPLRSRFHYQSSGALAASNQYSRPEVECYDTHLSNRFHSLVPQIVDQYRDSFIDQLRCTHFLGMAGNEATMLYPSQQRRLCNEKVQRIAGEIRHIQTGFGDYRFNAPQPHNLRPLLALYAHKVESLIDKVDDISIHNLVSFAQYYFALLHPFYERCGRTSEELMYLLFEQAGFGWRYISAKGNRTSRLAYKRMMLINAAAEAFNRRIAGYFCLMSPHEINKTPDLYRALTARYFPERYNQVYDKETPKPFYYHHPIPQIMDAYYFVMEGLLLDEIAEFNLENPYPHIKRLGWHLREKGKNNYKGNVPKVDSSNSLRAILNIMASTSAKQTSTC